MKAKIANAEQAKVHTMLVIGGRVLEGGTSRCDCTVSAMWVRSQRAKSWLIFCQRSKSGETKFELVSAASDCYRSN